MPSTKSKPESEPKPKPKSQTKPKTETKTKPKAGAKRKTETTPWDSENPKTEKGEPHQTLSPADKASAKRHAKAAGRPYPNLIDNMQAARKAKGKST